MGRTSLVCGAVRHAARAGFDLPAIHSWSHAGVGRGFESRPGLRPG